MLRTLLLAGPLALVLVSCGDSAPAFDDSHLPGTNGSSGSAGTAPDSTTDDTPGTTGDAGASSSGGSSNAQAGTSAHGGAASGGKSGEGGAGKGGGNGGSGEPSSSGTGGGNSGGSSSGGGGSGGTSSGAGTSSGGGSTAGTSGGGMPGGGMPGGGMPGGGMAGTGGWNPWGGSWGGRNCPDVTGNYNIASVEGACNGFNHDAPQSIEDASLCSIRFVSSAQMGNAGINGTATLDRNGEFSGTVLYFGKNLRSPCSGVWDDAAGTMTVECGFQNEVCTVVLEQR